MFFIIDELIPSQKLQRKSECCKVDHSLAIPSALMMSVEPLYVQLDCIIVVLLAYFLYHAVFVSTIAIIIMICSVCGCTNCPEHYQNSNITNSNITSFHESPNREKSSEWYTQMAE